MSTLIMEGISQKISRFSKLFLENFNVDSKALFEKI